jgi:hypothetical protein
MVQGYLESEGIDTILEDDINTHFNSIYPNALGGVKVLVRDEDLEKALLLLQKGGYLNSEKNNKIELVKLDKNTKKGECPFCHSDNIGKAKSPDYIMLIASLILGAFIPSLRQPNICFDCGKEWKYEK